MAPAGPPCPTLTACEPLTLLFVFLVQIHTSAGETANESARYTGVASGAFRIRFRAFNRKRKNGEGCVSIIYIYVYVYVYTPFHSVNVYIYIYMYVCTVNMHIYIYIYKESTSTRKSLHQRLICSNMTFVSDISVQDRYIGRVALNTHTHIHR